MRSSNLSQNASHAEVSIRNFLQEGHYRPLSGPLQFIYRRTSLHNIEQPLQDLLNKKETS
jgi:hypothetical protein